MRGQLECHRLGHRDVAHLAPLGWRERQRAGQDRHLPADVDDAAEEVDVLDREAEHLALAQPQPGREGCHHPVAVRQRVVDGDDLLGQPGLDPRGV